MLYKLTVNRKATICMQFIFYCIKHFMNKARNIDLNHTDTHSVIRISYMALGSHGRGFQQAKLRCRLTTF